MINHPDNQDPSFHSDLHTRA
jgi:hypothetical protein